MGKPHDPVLLALIATLEEQARKRGKPSVIKKVVARLVAAGTDDATVAQVTALKTPAAPRPKPAKPRAAKVAAKSGQDGGKAKTAKVLERPPGALQ